MRQVFTVRLISGAVLSGGQDQNVRIWSLHGECVVSLPHGAIVRGLVGADAGGGFVASVGGKGDKGKRLVVWRADPPVVAPTAPSKIASRPSFSLRRLSGAE